MRASTVLLEIFCTLVALALPSLCLQANESIVVDEAPDYVRPYILPNYRGRGVKLTPSQIIRFSITTNSSGGAFSLLQHNGKISGYTSARPHSHVVTHEHFYCARGRVQLWGKKLGGNSSEEARVATVGDYGGIPPGALHTFQLTDPNAQLTHVFQPAGFEHLFDVFSGGDWDTEGLSSPYAPIPADDPPFGPLTPEQDTLLRSLDLVATEHMFRRDFVNGTAGDDSLNWHNGPNELPPDNTTPYFIAKDYGPKYLNSEDGYKIVQPLSTPEQSVGGNFSMGTLILSTRAKGAAVATTELPHHFALQMEDGQLTLTIQGYPPTNLIHGDVAFIPAGVPFTYVATVPYTKFLYMNAGAQGLDYQLMKNSVEWGWPAYPES